MIDITLVFEFLELGFFYCVLCLVVFRLVFELLFYEYGYLV